MIFPLAEGYAIPGSSQPGANNVLTISAKKSCRGDSIYGALREFHFIDTHRESMAKKKIPFVDLGPPHSPLLDSLHARFEQTLLSGDFILGNFTEQFERKVAGWCHRKYGVAVNSGTDALYLGLRALRIGSGDEVILPSNVFIAVAAAVSMTGAKPVFADIGDDLNIDPSSIRKNLSSRTRAVIAVHLTGRPCRIDSIRSLCKENKIHLVEDCAQSLGAAWNKKPLGSFGIISCFSFHPLKTLSACGDAGMILCDSKVLRDRLRRLRNLGLQSRNNCLEWSLHSRMDNLQAALLLEKSKYFQKNVAQKRRIAAIYNKSLSGIPDIALPVDPPCSYPVFSLYMLLSPARDRLSLYLKRRGIETAIHYPVPIHLQTIGKQLGYRKGSLPRTEKACKQILSLPIYPHLADDDVHYICSTIRSFFAERT